MDNMEMTYGVKEFLAWYYQNYTVSVVNMPSGALLNSIKQTRSSNELWYCRNRNYKDRVCYITPKIKGKKWVNGTQKKKNIER